VTGLKGGIKRGVEPRKLATLIISPLEGLLMMGRLEWEREALLETQSHLENSRI
jgi:hypothetical protein